MVNPPEALPVFVVPYSAGASFVWCPRLEGGTLAGLRVAGAAASIHERKKLLRPGQNLEVLFVDGVSLRDGAECALDVTAVDGHEVSCHGLARLARWDDGETRRALSLIANRFTSAQGSSPVLERYLAFISTWQAPAHLISVFPEGCLIEVDATCQESDITIYAVTGHGLRRIEAKVLHNRDGKLTLWLDAIDAPYAYLEIQGSLVRINLDVRPVRPAAPFTDAADGPELVEALHGIVEGPSEELAAWAAGRCRAQTSVHSDEGTIRLFRAVRLPDSGDVAFFLSIAGEPADLRQLRIEAFGEREDLDSAIIARDVDSEAGEFRQQIVVTAFGPRSTSRCFKLSWVCAGQPNATWIRETDAADTRNRALAQEFAPLALVNRKTFETVLHPLAAAAEADVAPGLLQIIDLTDETAKPYADIVVFVGRDLEALHRTVLGLSLTTRNTPFSVHLCLFDPRLTAALETAARNWTRMYAVDFRLSIFSSRTTDAQVARQFFASARPQILCRAGVAPRLSGWLPQILSKLESRPNGILVGADSGLGAAGQDNASVVRLASLNRSEAGAGLADRIIAAAVAPGVRPNLEATPCFYTLEGFILVQAFQGAAGETLKIDDNLRFTRTGTTDCHDDFHAQIDSYSLQILHKSSPAARLRVRKRVGHVAAE
ncbi:hypothetical protein ACD578_27630 (plasmid) [Microvirga sp. RSM25]|uniref:hypothetical protein n=1 Tax=Microvirga sp. RSM25 TaxID=3273802 RepID=UPI0038513EAF